MLGRWSASSLSVGEVRRLQPSMKGYHPRLTSTICPQVTIAAKLYQFSELSSKARRWPKNWAYTANPRWMLRLSLPKLQSTTSCTCLHALESQWCLTNNIIDTQNICRQLGYCGRAKHMFKPRNQKKVFLAYPRTIQGFYFLTLSLYQCILHFGQHMASSYFPLNKTQHAWQHELCCNSILVFG